VIARENWFEAGGGECGFVVLIRATGTSFIRTAKASSLATIKGKRNGKTSVRLPIDNSGHGAVDLTHRFQWVSPLMLSPHNPDVLYTAAGMRFKSTDDGQAGCRLAAISPAMTNPSNSRAAAR